MMLHPVGAYLSRFEDKNAVFDTTPSEIDRVEDVAPTHCVDTAPSQFELVETAVEEARAALRAEYEHNLQIERERFAEALRFERQRWTLEEGERIAAAFETGLRASVEGLKGAVERVLAPFIAREILQRLLDDFVGTLQTAIANTENPVIRLSGPEDLLDIIERQLATRSIVISRMSEVREELLAQIDLTSIETDIGYWMDQVGGITRKDG